MPNVLILSDNNVSLYYNFSFASKDSACYIIEKYSAKLSMGIHADENVRNGSTKIETKDIIIIYDASVGHKDNARKRVYAEMNLDGAKKSKNKNNLTIIIRKYCSKQRIQDENMPSGTEIDHFHTILKQISYEPQIKLSVQAPSIRRPVDKNKEHIPNFYSLNRDNWHDVTGGHWVCCHYHEEKIFIYDSVERRYLHRHHKISLEKLFPFYILTRKNIEYTQIQLQPNGVVCSVFAIVFGVTLALGGRSEMNRYDHPKMQNHLIHLLTNNFIQNFPVLNDSNVVSKHNRLNRKRVLDDNKAFEFDKLSSNNVVQDVSRNDIEYHFENFDEVFPKRCLSYFANFRKRFA